ncbi:uncharacterized protein LOC118458829 isoform X2 [Anopheles albimanus]|nr:uncharacterized protein LOC118458829 isoform X2 [Anopheles albimanus]
MIYTLFGEVLLLIAVAIVTTSNCFEIPGRFEDVESSFIGLEEDKQSGNAAKQTNINIYHELESPGLHSHFLQSDRFDPEYTSKGTQRELKQVSPSTFLVESTEKEHIPTAEKLTMTNQQNYPAVQAEWTKTSSTPEFQANVIREQEDSNAEASVRVNGNMKPRAPRVNFITQQTKSPDHSEIRTGKEKKIYELYKKPIARLHYERPVPKAYDSFMAPTQPAVYPSRSFNKYEPLHPEMFDRMHPPAPHQYDHYYERRYDVDYDSYFPRYKYPYYYYFPDNRYDIPMPHWERNYIYTNNVLKGFSGTNRPISMRNRRIIYYATLPEIVRTRPNAEMRYRLQGYRNKYDPFQVPSPTVTFDVYKEKVAGVASSVNNNKFVSSKPIKIIRETNFSGNGIGKQLNNDTLTRKNLRAG